MNTSFSLTSSLAVLGAVTLLYVFVKTSLVVYNGFKAFVLSRWLRLGVDFKSVGSWAVVTGATDGIGKGYAEQLAKRGLDVVLISRSADKLATVAREIETNFAVKTKCITVDFKGGPEIYDKIASELGDRDVGVLVNNVGWYAPGWFLDTAADGQVLQDQISVNCNAVVFVTKIVLPKMVQREKGVIINLSSAVGVVPMPVATVYSATKAFVDFFSRALHAEHASKGIIVQSVTPGYVRTPLVSPFTKKASVFIADVTTYVQSALNTVGLQTRTCGYLPHAVMMFILRLLPEWVAQHYISTPILAVMRAAKLEMQQQLKEKTH